jgi:hypothetical protein
MEPTRTQTMCTAVGARRSGCTISCMPFFSVNCARWKPRRPLRGSGTGCDDAPGAARPACAQTGH